jgi:hypothetical protein
MWRSGVFALVMLAGCGTDQRGAIEARTFEFGPFTVPENSEDTGQCVQITIGNDEPLFVNSVELTTGPGFHHSNWFYVPEHVFAGPDGTFNCDDRSFNQATAGIFGGVFFAQSTQSAHEVQTFPEGVVVKVPPHSKLVSQIHLLNSGDEPLEIKPTIGFTPIAQTDVKTLLTSVTFEYHPLGLPPEKQSKFSVECDISKRHQEAFGRAPDFNIYYALAHYHEWGTGLTIEAVRDDNTASTIYSTKGKVGDALGGMLSPTFSMSGYSKLRLTCDYYNNTSAPLYYGNGAGEMCIFLAFSDSPYIWAGGALDEGTPGDPVSVDGGIMSYTEGCQVFATDGSR